MLAELLTLTHWSWDSHIRLALMPHLCYVTLMHMSTLKSNCWEFIWDPSLEPERSHSWSIGYACGETVRQSQWDVDSKRNDFISTRGNYGFKSWSPWRKLTDTFVLFTHKRMHTLTQFCKPDPRWIGTCNLLPWSRWSYPLGLSAAHTDTQTTKLHSRSQQQ